jgi:hypothetical protein
LTEGMHDGYDGKEKIRGVAVLLLLLLLFLAL